MKIKTVEINSLRPASYNPRIQLKPGDPEFEKLKKSIQEFGHVYPVIVNKDMTIVGGHQTVSVLKALGNKTVEVNIVDLTKAKEKILNVALNKISGEWDFEKLADLMKGLKDDDIDISTMGFDEGEINKIFKDQENLNDPDDIPAVPKKAITKKGDLWILGDHRLLCGDSTNAGDAAKLMDGKKADMFFTDPPYGVSYSKKNKFLNSISPGNRIQRDIENDGWSEDETCAFWLKSFEIIRDNLADVNSYYIFGPQIQGMMMMMMMMMMKAGLPCRHVLIWVKNNHVLGRCDYNYRHEPIFFGWTKTHKFKRAGEFLSSVWEVDKPLKNDLHPTMKPVQLIENALLNSSVAGSICFDPFGGSGSTLIACEKNNRRCLMMEIDPLYCDVIVERWQKFTGKKADRNK